MTGKLNFLIVFLLAFFGTKSAMASHAFGAELTYTCIGTNQYRLTCHFYRDCSGIPAPTTISINFANSDGLPNPPSINLAKDTGFPVQIPQLCPRFTPTTCSAGSYFGVEEYSYSGVVTLTGASVWTVSHTESARSSALTTITGAGSDNLHVFCTINNSDAACNNSPVFSNQPSIFFCAQTFFCYDPLIIDPDGDSISVQLITPRTGPNASDTVHYHSGYSATQPLISSPLMTFDTHTGILCGTPTQQDVSVTALLVSEYRNGVLIGQVERDVTLLVQACNNATPTISGMNGTNMYTMNAIAGSQICFYVTSGDPDSNDSTVISATNNLPGMTFLNTGSKHDSAAVCWTPTASDTLTNPNCLTLQVRDNSCPYPSVHSVSYCFNVSPVDAIQEILSQNISVYPNPTSDFISVKALQSSRYSLFISDMSGRQIMPAADFSISLQVDLSKLERGIYLLVIQDKASAALVQKRLVVE